MNHIDDRRTASRSSHWRSRTDQECPIGSVFIAECGGQAPAAARRRPGVGSERELLEPTLQRRAVDADEVPAVATDHRDARPVRPLIQDFYADLAWARVSKGGD